MEEDVDWDGGVLRWFNTDDTQHVAYDERSLDDLVAFIEAPSEKPLSSKQQKALLRRAMKM